MTTDPSFEELARYLGLDAATALVRWCELTSRRVLIPVDRWFASGYTGALIAPLFVQDPRTGARLVLIKTLLPGQTTEPAAHRRALQEAPPAFQRHLVELLHEPIALAPDGGIMFQALAGNSRDWRPLADIPVPRLAEVCAAVTRSLLTEWNHGFAIRNNVSELEFLREAMKFAASMGRSVSDHTVRAAWLRAAGDEPIPNPLSLISDGGAIGDRRADIIIGRGHGDLHSQNVLLEQRRGGRLDVDSFVLVDLMTYLSDGPIDRDLVTMLLSVTARILPDLSEPQRTGLLSVFVQPEEDAPGVLPPVAIDPLTAIYRTGAACLVGLGTDLWRQQFLRSLIVHGLIFTTFHNLGPANRWWFFRLAGHAARELYGLQPPGHVAVVENPFRAEREAGTDAWVKPEPGPLPEPMPAPAAVPAPTPVVAPVVAPVVTPRPERPGGWYTGVTKLRVCQRLGDDWADLADLLEIPRHERARFERGHEAREIWDWLARRQRLGELAGALDLIGRDDLARLLTSEGA